MSKKGSFENKWSLTIFLFITLFRSIAVFCGTHNILRNIPHIHYVFSWLHLSSLLVRCVKDLACKSSHNIVNKQNERFNLYMFNVIYMWPVHCVVHWALFATHFLSRGWVCYDQCPRIFWGIICQGPSVSKCNQLHADIFRFSFIDLRYIWKEFCKMIGNKPDVLNLNWLFLNLNWFMCK